LGSLDVTAPPLHMHGTPASVRLAPPVLGQHTEEILAELGFDRAYIRELEESRAVATARKKTGPA
jgi:crotonobetainyl-CoA:carnitine CoA-transferase CaiB-like acyl-CoA transferase